MLPARELHWRFSRSSGPGGQGVNTADSRVELSFDVARSPSFPPHLRERARARLAPPARRRGADRRRLGAPQPAAQPGRRPRAARRGAAGGARPRSRPLGGRPGRRRVRSGAGSTPRPAAERSSACGAGRPSSSARPVGRSTRPTPIVTFAGQNVPTGRAATAAVSRAAADGLGVDTADTAGAGWRIDRGGVARWRPDHRQVRAGGLLVASPTSPSGADVPPVLPSIPLATRSRRDRRASRRSAAWWHGRHRRSVEPRTRRGRARQGRGHRGGPQGRHRQRVLRRRRRDRPVQPLLLLLRPGRAALPLVAAVGGVRDRLRPDGSRCRRLRVPRLPEGSEDPQAGADDREPPRHPRARTCRNTRGCPGGSASPSCERADARRRADRTTRRCRVGRRRGRTWHDGGPIHVKIYVRFVQEDCGGQPDQPQRGGRPARAPVDPARARDGATRGRASRSVALVTDVTTQLCNLVRAEVELAKAEVTAEVRKGVTGSVFFAVAARDRPVQPLLLLLRPGRAALPLVAAVGGVRHRLRPDGSRSPRCSGSSATGRFRRSASRSGRSRASASPPRCCSTAAAPTTVPSWTPRARRRADRTTRRCCGGAAGASP